MGFWSMIAIIASPAYFGFFTIYMMAHWYTALIELGIIVIICHFAIKRHEKHHRPEKYDDRLFKR